MRTLRPCLQCGTPTHTKPAYCLPCSRTNPAAKTRAARPHYQGDWQAQSRKFRTEYLKQYGPLCPGYDKPSHYVRPEDLVVDHVTPRDSTRIRVTCRSCNSTKGNDEKRENYSVS